MRSHHSAQQINPYQKVTDAILARLQQGAVPWQQPWRAVQLDGEEVHGPVNALSLRPYGGTNRILLGSLDYNDPRFLTFRQCQSLGGHVRRGEKGHRAIYWQERLLRRQPGDSTAKAPRNQHRGREEPREQTHEDDDREDGGGYLILRPFTVFNIAQCEGLQLAPLALVQQPTADEAAIRAGAVMQAMPNPPHIGHVPSGATGVARYLPAQDLVELPHWTFFSNAHGYCATAFHELAHSTGHRDRLNREELGRGEFGSGIYSREELVAEIAAAFLCTECGVNSQIDNQAAYVGSWLSMLQNDPTMFVVAAARAQKAADYILRRPVRT